MNSMTQVASLLLALIQQGLSKPEVVREIAKACVGWPYVFGAWGEQCTPTGRKRRKRDDHPTIVSACQVLSGKKDTCEGCKWNLPVRMFDCRGFTDWVLSQIGIDLKGEGCTSQWNTKANWIVKGPISEMPRDKVCCVFTGTSKTKEHTGLYLGDGTTVECSSGVQYFDPMKSKWGYYAIPAGLYDGGEIPMPTPGYPTLRQGSKGDIVITMQELLAKTGSSLVIDGIFGVGTRSAVVSFQKNNGLEADGICGPKTWAKLLEVTKDVPETSTSTPVEDGKKLEADLTAEQKLEILWADYKSRNGG